VDVPDFATLIDPTKVSPLLNNTESPGSKLVKKEFNLVIDFHGVEVF
jgi:hypothetical protein